MIFVGRGFQPRHSEPRKTRALAPEGLSSLAAYMRWLRPASPALEDVVLNHYISFSNPALTIWQDLVPKTAFLSEPGLNTKLRCHLAREEAFD